MRSTLRAQTTKRATVTPGERYGAVYQINYLRCILCGLCIEACPTRALTMTNEYELADTSREAHLRKDDLLAPLMPGMVEAPHSMVAGTTSKDYYDGKVTGSTPAQQEKWRLVKRPLLPREAEREAAKEQERADAAASEEAAMKVARDYAANDEAEVLAAGPRTKVREERSERSVPPRRQQWQH